MEIVDTHQHLWDLERFRYSWLQSYPTLNRSFLMSDYLTATKDLNVTKSVHLEADADEPFMRQETSYLLGLSEQADNPLEGIVASGRPEAKDFRSYLEKIVGHPKLKGIRRVLHTQPDDLGERNIFLENVAALADYSLSFDICVLARQLPTAIRLVSQCPDVTFILDHCGTPQIKDKILHPWRLHIAELAKFPNIVCKVSGLVAYADPTTWTADDLRPYVEHVIACFGWDRILFGSDWPVCTLSASYQQWADVLLSMVRFASQTEQRKLFHDNALRVYRLE